MMHTHSSRRRVFSLLGLAALCLAGTGRALRSSEQNIPDAAIARTDSVSRRVAAMLPDTNISSTAIMLRSDCQACHSLVATLLKRARAGIAPASPYSIVSNSSWPQLDSLLHSDTLATLALSHEVAGLPVTPTARVFNNHSTTISDEHRFAWGTRQILALLNPEPHTN